MSVSGYGGELNETSWQPVLWCPGSEAQKNRLRYASRMPISFFGPVL